MAIVYNVGKQVVEVTTGTGDILYSCIDFKDGVYGLGISEHPSPQPIGTKSPEYEGEMVEDMAGIKVLIRFPVVASIDAMIYQLVDLKKRNMRLGKGK